MHTMEKRRIVAMILDIILY